MIDIEFTENTGLAPLPFDTRIMRSALRLRSLGLKWRPDVGCFVWDHKDVIRTPSPFPMNIYFILNLRRFEAVLGSIGRIQTELVWLPTWHQALLLCQKAGIDTFQTEGDQEKSSQPVDGLLHLYESIADALGG